MKTLIVRYGDRVRFLITGHPEYRFGKLQEQMPVKIEMFGVTSKLARDIKLRYATKAVHGTLWYQLDDEFEQYLSENIGR